ncbi:unnamed protein product [Lepeophtheirus salmonis]|uniref:(salmon louse) hypothetical protein n=1 Tax=Lepeophtheirus salmonis TaxID=72036 RepID=A0A7R8CGW2_LEPSM|nr:unnamed protein product [Lepeophtheirus salmonis]CAF2815333.1 unnamed protein product [Lepeophtheirus salmonis]
MAEDSVSIVNESTTLDDEKKSTDKSELEFENMGYVSGDDASHFVEEHLKSPDKVPSIHIPTTNSTDKENAILGQSSELVYNRNTDISQITEGVSAKVVECEKSKYQSCNINLKNSNECPSNQTIHISNENYESTSDDTVLKDNNVKPEQTNTIEGSMPININNVDKSIKVSSHPVNLSDYALSNDKEVIGNNPSYTDEFNHQISQSNNQKLEVTEVESSLGVYTPESATNSVLSIHGYNTISDSGNNQQIIESPTSISSVDALHAENSAQSQLVSDGSSVLFDPIINQRQVPCHSPLLTTKKDSSIHSPRPATSINSPRTVSIASQSPLSQPITSPHSQSSPQQTSPGTLATAQSPYSNNPPQQPSPSPSVIPLSSSSPNRSNTDGRASRSPVVPSTQQHAATVNQQNVAVAAVTQQQQHLRFYNCNPMQMAATHYNCRDFPTAVHHSMINISSNNLNKPAIESGSTTYYSSSTQQVTNPRNRSGPLPTSLSKLQQLTNGLSSITPTSSLSTNSNRTHKQIIHQQQLSQQQSQLRQISHQNNQQASILSDYTSSGYHQMNGRQVSTNNLMQHYNQSPGMTLNYHHYGLMNQFSQMYPHHTATVDPHQRTASTSVSGSIHHQQPPHHMYTGYPGYFNYR